MCRVTELRAGQTRLPSSARSPRDAPRPQPGERSGTRPLGALYSGRRPRHPGRDSALTNRGHKKQPRVGGGESRRSPAAGVALGKAAPARRPGAAPARLSPPGPSSGRHSPHPGALETSGTERRAAGARRAAPNAPDGAPRPPPDPPSTPAEAPPAAPLGPPGIPRDRSPPLAPSPAAHAYLSAVRSARPPRPLRRSPSPRCPPAAGPWPGPTPRRRLRAAAPRCEAPRRADRRGRTRLMPPSTLRGARRGEIGRDGTERTAPLARSRDPLKPDPKLRTCHQQRVDQHRPPVHGRAQRPGSRTAQPRSAATLRPHGPAAGRRRWGGAGRGWGPPLLREGLLRGAASVGVCCGARSRRMLTGA